MPPVDDFLAGLDDEAREVFARILAVALDLVPEAEQGVSYGMPALRLRGKPLLGFRVARHHLSVFPFSPAAIDAARAELAGLDLAKGTVRFTVQQPMPQEGVRALVLARAAEITGSSR